MAFALLTALCIAAFFCSAQAAQAYLLPLLVFEESAIMARVITGS